MKSRSTTQVTARFAVIAPDGRRYDVTETTTREQYALLEGGWTPPGITSIRYDSGRTPVNLLDDGTFEVLTSPNPTVCRRA